MLKIFRTCLVGFCIMPGYIMKRITWGIRLSSKNTQLFIAMQSDTTYGFMLYLDMLSSFIRFIFHD